MCFDADSGWYKPYSIVLAQPHQSNWEHQFCPLASLTLVEVSRLWCMAEGAQLDKAKPQLSSGKGTPFDLFCFLPWKRRHMHCWCAHSRTWGSQSSNHFARCLNFLEGCKYKVCVRLKGEYVSLHPRPISIYFSTDRRMSKLSRKYTCKGKMKCTDKGGGKKSILTYMLKSNSPVIRVPVQM